MEVSRLFLFYFLLTAQLPVILFYFSSTKEDKKKKHLRNLSVVPVEVDDIYTWYVLSITVSERGDTCVYCFVPSVSTRLGGFFFNEHDGRRCGGGCERTTRRQVQACVRCGVKKAFYYFVAFCFCFCFVERANFLLPGLGVYTIYISYLFHQHEFFMVHLSMRIKAVLLLLCCESMNFHRMFA